MRNIFNTIKESHYIKMSHTIDGACNINSARDIHFTDTHLIKYQIHTRFSHEDKLRIINALLRLINERANSAVKEYGLKGIIIIRNDAGNAPNWSGADQLLADDVLCEICDILADEQDDEVINTVINHICEQMKDMIDTSGYCASGRVARIHQIYMFLKDKNIKN